MLHRVNQEFVLYWNGGFGVYCLVLARRNYWRYVIFTVTGQVWEKDNHVRLLYCRTWALLLSSDRACLIFGISLPLKRKRRSNHSLGSIHRQEANDRLGTLWTSYFPITTSPMSRKACNYSASAGLGCAPRLNAWELDEPHFEVVLKACTWASSAQLLMGSGYANPEPMTPWTLNLEP